MADQSNVDGPDRRTAQRRPQKATLAALKITILVLIAVVVTCKPDSFACGLAGKPAWTTACVITLGVPVAVLALGFLLYRSILKLVRWKPTRFWTKLTYASLLICLYFSPVVLPGTSHRLGFYYWARSHVDIPAGVSWAESFQVPQRDPNEPDLRYVKVNLDSLPAPFRSVTSKSYAGGNYIHAADLGPKVLYDKQARTMVLVWGGGILGSWGISIGRDVVNRVEIHDHLAVGTDAYVWWHE